MKMSIEKYNKLVEFYSTELAEFYKTLDRAHGVDHFVRVFDCAVILNRSLPVEMRFKEEMLLAVAFTHDIYSGLDRDNHHDLAGMFVRDNTNTIFRNFDEIEVEMIALACEQHRASFKGSFSNLFSELMNSADRETPKGVSEMLERAILYREDHNPEETSEEVFRESVKHVKEKYGHGGYARYPNLYERIFARELQLVREEIDKL